MVDAERIKKAVVELLSAIGEDPNREELLATPEKVATAVLLSLIFVLIYMPVMALIFLL